MGTEHVRAFVEADIPPVERLHGMVFNTGERLAVNGRDLYRDHFTRVFLSSRRPDVRRAFQDGNTSFSRLDGEWCLSFQTDRPVTWGTS